jgi:hypothetical protein
VSGACLVGKGDWLRFSVAFRNFGDPLDADIPLSVRLIGPDLLGVL